MKLFDVHAHTNLSYCASSDLTLSVYRSALDDPGGLLGKQAVTNHGFQAYFPPDIAWSWTFLDAPELFDKYRHQGEEKLLSFHEEIERTQDDRLVFGVEVELMGDGRLTCTERVLEKAQIVVGSLHVMPQCYLKGESLAETIEAYLNYTRDLLRSGIDVLAHPFRWLTETVGYVTPALVTEVVSLCAAHNVAIELNTRAGGPGIITMIKEAAQGGVPIALATDAHSASEVGKLEPHLEAIRRAGFDPEKINLYSSPSGNQR